MKETINFPGTPTSFLTKEMAALLAENVTAGLETMPCICQVNVLVVGELSSRLETSTWVGAVPISKRFKVLKNGKIAESVIPGRYAGHRPDKIFGRLDCKSGMRMKKENRVFFLTWEDAIAAGYRPCRNCKPTPSD